MARQGTKIGKLLKFFENLLFMVTIMDFNILSRFFVENYEPKKLYEILEITETMSHTESQNHMNKKYWK